MREGRSKTVAYFAKRYTRLVQIFGMHWWYFRESASGR